MTKEKKLETKKKFENLEQALEEFNNQFPTDKRLFRAEIEVDLACCDALFKAGILNRIESDKIKNTLQTIEKRASFDETYLDNFPAKSIQNFVEARLFQLIGDTGLKIKTGRTDEEQIATVLRFWMRKLIERISKQIAHFQKILVQKCFDYKEAIIPGFSNGQNIHPILFAHWGLSYFEVFSRDLERLDEVWRRVNVLPLGAGKLAGTSYEIDYEEIARDLGFEGINSNSLDAVADRDFTVEFVNACSIIMIHLSRLAADLILFSSEENSFIGFKKTESNSHENFANALKKITTETEKIFSNQAVLLSSLKGMSLSFNSEMLELHEIVFDSADRLDENLKISKMIFSKIILDQEKAHEIAEKGSFRSDEMINYLIHRGVSFGTATEKVRKIKDFADSKKKGLDELSLEDLRNFSDDFEADIFESISLEKVLESKKQIGGTSPERVFEALEKASESLERE